MSLCPHSTEKVMPALGKRWLFIPRSPEEEQAGDEAKCSGFCCTSRPGALCPSWNAEFLDIHWGNAGVFFRAEPEAKANQGLLSMAPLRAGAGRAAGHGC